MKIKYLETPVQNNSMDKIVYTRADKPIVCMPKMAHGKISLAHSTKCSPNYFDSFCQTSISILWRIYVCVCVYIYIYIYIYVCVCVCVCVYIHTHTHTHTHTCTYIHIPAYRMFMNYCLLLLPNNTAREAFLHKSGLVWSTDCIFTIEVLCGGDWAEYVILDTAFYCLLFKQKVVPASLTSKFSSLSHSSTRPY